MAEGSSVKVGVRVRPLLTKEKTQPNVLSNHDHNSLEFKGQTFTFDHVFGVEKSQQNLYEETAAPMLKSFLEGYNVTIMAYGQTGSGKSYTMGTGDVSLEDQENQGLIPRFIFDLFENLNDYGEGEKLAITASVSFCEIYGEDVYDLLPESHTPLSFNESRPSLAVRENEQGNIFVQGQNEVVVNSAEHALDMLVAGAKNRITASTSMNAGSSRSHAVFSVILKQGPVNEDGTEEGDSHKMTSRLTLVDLAGSERIKRTGAEGIRLKEGIQINSGLFNLGQVINGLADDQRLKSGLKAGHIPYRNSKLTHLLKDALGGNSQTLFLACVSPAEFNESETFSTLSVCTVICVVCSI